ncbi:acyl-CoA dehydrogenase family protein [Intestinimonas sp. HCP28S3_D6]|uniref:acyl-CoA dehydrogenase family protein n=1 Tax=Intestinimonas sp. HCP28S3_D6 TaxID=3438942 RepID=UPI003F8CC0D1
MVFSEDNLMLRQLARDFANKELTPDLLDQVEETNVFPEEVLQKMADIGFFGIKIPEEYGGMGGNNMDYIAVIEEISRVSAVASLYVSAPNGLGGGPLLISGTEAQKQKYLPPLVTNEKKMCFALTEPGAGSDASSIITKAEDMGDYFLLNGRKTFITRAPLCADAVVYAKTKDADGKVGVSAFIVDMHSEGVSTGSHVRKMGLIGAATSDIVLEDVKVPKENLLGELNQGFKVAMKTLDGGRLGVAAMSVGVAQSCLDEAVKYTKVRKQFGKAIADFQNTKFTLADMATKLQAARELLYSAAEAKDRGENCSALVSMAKYYASEICNELAAKALQLHGGYGYTKEYRIERLYRDCRVFTIFEGTSQIQQTVIARSLLKD